MSAERVMPCCLITPCAVLRENESRQGVCAAADWLVRWRRTSRLGRVLR